MLGFLLKAGLAVAGIGLGLDLLKKHEDKVNSERERLPLLKDRDLPNTPVDLPKVINLDHKDEKQEEDHVSQK